MNVIGIDLYTDSKRNIMRRLSRLKSVVEVVDMGAYCQYTMFSKIKIQTSMTVEQVDDWLYALKGDYTDYVGAYAIENVKGEIE